MSIDGRIADARGNMDWLTAFNVEGNDFGYAEFYNRIDALVMGRTTYEFVAARSVWPYPGKRCHVVSSRPLSDAPDEVRTVPADFDALRARLLAEEDQTVWILGGGRTQRGCLDAGMLDELTLFVMPVVLGSGPLAFADGPRSSARLAGQREWPGGILELRYQFPDSNYG